MKFYLAPLEGLTGYIYRNAMERYFPGTDRYFTPFIAPDQNRILRTKEHRDVLPENNEVKNLIPQILTNNAEHFIHTAEALQEFGYNEVNLNLGCPSGTVVSRGRGSGFLAYPEELDRFLEQIFEGSKTGISIKTRVGVENSDDAFRLLEIYRKYPLSELIIHPRTRKEFYRGVPDLELFGEMAKWWADSFSGEKIPLCYNGNIMSTRDYETFTNRFPDIDCIMLGRGAIANPGLIRQLKTGIPTDKKNLRAFHDEILEAQRDMVHEDKNAMFRMKEMWIYMIHLFGPTKEEIRDHERIYGNIGMQSVGSPYGENAMQGVGSPYGENAVHCIENQDSGKLLRMIDSRVAEKCAKKIRKAQILAEYKCAVDQLFAECELLHDGPKKWNLPQK